MNFGLIIRTFKLMRGCDRRGFLWLIVLSVLSALLPLANLKVLQLMVDVGLEEKDMGQMLIYVGAFALVFFLSRCITTYYNAKQEILGQKFADYTNNMVQQHSSKMDMAYYDSADNHDRLYRAQQEANIRPLQLLNNSIKLFKSLISVLGIVTILAGSSLWAVAVLFVTVIPSFVVRLLKSRKLYSFNKESTVHMRRSRYLSSLVTSRGYAMEVKARGLAGFFCRKYAEIRQELRDMMRRIIWKMTAYDMLCALFEAVSVLAVTIILVKGTVGGAYSIGTFVMLFEAFRKGQSYFYDITMSLAGIYDNLLFIGNLFEFMEINPQVLDPDKPAAFPESVESVVFDNVCFSYPGGETPVLDHFCLSARKGEIARIEGPNGFGKTTIVKLLLRLYDPTDGAILINGVDIRNFRLEDLRRNVSAAFQELNIYNFSIRENIRFGDITSLEAVPEAAREADQEAVPETAPEAGEIDRRGIPEAASETGDSCAVGTTHRSGDERMAESVRLSESTSIIDNYPDGLDTMVGREFDNGVVPSMGQRQRLCLARHFYSNAPIMVFDEPTAWMDVASRDAFVQHIKDLSREKLVIYISHIQ